MTHLVHATPQAKAEIVLGGSSFVTIASCALAVCSGQSITITNVPETVSVGKALEALEFVGAIVEWNTKKKTVALDASGITTKVIPEQYARYSPELVIVALALAARFGKGAIAASVTLPFPVGSFESVGFVGEERKGFYVFEPTAIPHATTLRHGSLFESVAVLCRVAVAEQQYVVKNISTLPGITQLLSLYAAVGGGVTQDQTTMTIDPVDVALRDEKATIAVPVSLLEAVFWASYAVGNRGDITIQNVEPAMLVTLLKKLKDMHVPYRVDGTSVRVWYAADIQAVSFDIGQYPAVSVQWLATLLPMLTQLNGESFVHLDDEQYEDIAKVVNFLRSAGAEIRYIKDTGSLKIFGPTKLSVGTYTCSNAVEMLGGLVYAGIVGEEVEVMAEESYLQLFDAMAEKCNMVGITT